ncbi:MAG TPA: MFS transporter [Caldimonas sp.]|nr:MFS transporter [Caldimonas sp.]
MRLGRRATVATLGTTQTLAWASSYYLPAMLAVPMARDTGVSVPTVFAAFSCALVVSALIGPRAGSMIDRWGGRPVLMGTSIVFTLGLVALGFAKAPLGLFSAWMLLGIGMGTGLYESAFATLVHLYRRDSRNAITGITLIAGFASTVGWPLSTWLEAQVGWRGACFAWAALHVLVGLPLNALLPRASGGQAAPVPAAPAASVDALDETAQWRATVILSFAFAATLFIATAMAAHLPRLIQTTGASLQTAVLVGTLIGPSQVAARLLEFSVLRRVHPLLSTRVAACLHPVGAIALLVFGAPCAALFGVLHGAGNGLVTIARGTLPLAIFGPRGYGERQGVLAVPARIAQALSPWLFGLALDRWDERSLLLSAGLGALAAASLFLPFGARHDAGAAPAETR